MKMDKREKFFCSIMVVGVVVAFSLVLIAHPWTFCAIDGIEDEFNENMGIAHVRLEKHWELLGTRVDIYGELKPSPLRTEIYCGHFFIDYFGNTDYIHLTVGDIPAWW